MELIITSCGIIMYYCAMYSLVPHIQFNTEVEENGTIAFLDTDTVRKKDGFLKVMVTIYRKATNTDQYLNFPLY